MNIDSEILKELRSIRARLAWVCFWLFVLASYLASILHKIAE